MKLKFFLCLTLCVAAALADKEKSTIEKDTVKPKREAPLLGSSSYHGPSYKYLPPSSSFGGSSGIGLAGGYDYSAHSGADSASSHHGGGGFFGGSGSQGHDHSVGHSSGPKVETFIIHNTAAHNHHGGSGASFGGGGGGYKYATPSFGSSGHSHGSSYSGHHGGFSSGGHKAVHTVVIPTHSISGGSGIGSGSGGFGGSFGGGGGGYKYAAPSFGSSGHSHGSSYSGHNGGFSSGGHRAVHTVVIPTHSLSAGQGYSGSSGGHGYSGSSGGHGHSSGSFGHGIFGSSGTSHGHAAHELGGHSYSGGSLSGQEQSLSGDGGQSGYQYEPVSFGGHSGSSSGNSYDGHSGGSLTSFGGHSGSSSGNSYDGHSGGSLTSFGGSSHAGSSSHGAAPAGYAYESPEASPQGPVSFGHSAEASRVPATSYGVPSGPLITSYATQNYDGGSYSGASGGADAPIYAAGQKGLGHFSYTSSRPTALHTDFIGSQQQQTQHSSGAPFKPSTFLGATHEAAATGSSTGGGSYNSAHFGAEYAAPNSQYLPPTTAGYDYPQPPTGLYEGPHADSHAVQESAPIHEPENNYLPPHASPQESSFGVPASAPSSSYLPPSGSYQPPSSLYGSPHH